MALRHVLWNLIGLGLPLLIAVVTVPPLIAKIGADRFGLLALAWALVGYAGALDLGVGRATTQRIATLIGARRQDEVPDVLASANRITMVAGAVGALFIAAAALSGVSRFVAVESVPDAEVRWSILILALALPVQAMSATYRGVNEAYLNFRGISLLRVALGAANFGGPFLIALYSNELHWLVGTLVVSRIIALVLYRRFAFACIRGALGRNVIGVFERNHALGLIRFGGWFSVSGIVSPLLVQVDRFFVGVMVSASAVTLYVLPYEVAVQALIFVGAVASVTFPMITRLIAEDVRQAMATFKRWLAVVAAGMLVVATLLALLMPSILRLWVGEHISAESIKVGQTLAVGIFLNSVGAMYFALLHAFGRTRLTALIHLFELPLYGVLLYVLIDAHGIVGAAYAWVARVAIDTSLLAIASYYQERELAIA